MTTEPVRIGGGSGFAELAISRQPAGEHTIEHDRPALALSFIDLPGSEVSLRGSARSEIITTRRGTHCVMPPGTVVEGRWRSDTHYLLARFNPENAGHVSGFCKAAATESRHRSADDPAILSLSLLIAAELEGGVPRGRMYLESLTTALLLSAFRVTQTGLTARPDHRLRRALDFMHANLHADLSIDDLAAEACMSRFHFTRLFTSSVGRSPYRYLIEQRLQLARTLLSTTNLPIAEISKRCGIGSAAHFARLFSRETGVTPSVFRRQK